MSNVLLIPAITGLVEALKQMGLPSRFAPAAALAFGIGAFYMMPLEMTLLEGILYGLGAVGLYSGPKAVAGR